MLQTNKDLKDVLFDLVRDIVLTVTKIESCVMADANVIAPKGEYATIRVQDNLVHVGTSSSRYENYNDDLMHVIVVPYYFDVIVNFYRGNAINYARLFSASDRYDKVKSKLRKAQVGWIRCSSIQDLTALQSNTREPRCEVKLRLVVADIRQEEVNAIHSVKLNVFDEKLHLLWEDTYGRGR